MQEDKAPLFDAMDQLSMCLTILPPLLEGIAVKRDAARRAAQGGHSNATDLADHLVERGVPFREAHEQVGRLVRLAISETKSLEQLSLEQIRSIAPKAADDVHSCLTVGASLNRRDALGGTSPRRVKAALQAAANRLDSESSDH
jgi:argininosuccinate lyase